MVGCGRARRGSPCSPAVLLPTFECDQIGLGYPGRIGDLQEKCEKSRNCLEKSQNHHCQNHRHQNRHHHPQSGSGSGSRSRRRIHRNRPHRHCNQDHRSNQHLRYPQYQHHNRHPLGEGSNEKYRALGCCLEPVLDLPWKLKCCAD